MFVEVIGKSSVADPKLFISDSDPDHTCKVITNPDPDTISWSLGTDPDQTFQVVQNKTHSWLKLSLFL
jgi:hypothetical protein